jgi:hypothetical protein
MTVAELEALVWQQLDDDGTFYPETAVRDALNEGQRFFCLLTLCLETTATFTLPANTTFFHMRQTYPDWMLPRRVDNSDGKIVRPAKLSELDALDPGWQASTGAPKRYAALGFDFFALYQQPDEDDSLVITYAQAPAMMSLQTDTPQIPLSSHFALANYATSVLRQVEGGQEFQKVSGYFNDFLDEAQKVQKLVKAKNLDSRYERMPFEIDRMDRSKLLQFRLDLAPATRRSQ